jgi:NADH dehydrogenase (ubiquinone) 1 alpha subcomplex subunit 8
VLSVEDFMLCKNENRDPGHCLKEGRRVTRCATDLCVLIHCLFSSHSRNIVSRITKMRENCLQQFDAHWNCLELHNQVSLSIQLSMAKHLTLSQEYYRCRKPERTLNKCMFEKLVRRPTLSALLAFF